MATDPTVLSIGGLARAFRSGELRPTAVAEAYLAKLEVGAVYRTILTDRALVQARRAERQFEAGVDVGPLQGIPLAIKDLLDVEGAVSGAGSKVLERGGPALADAPAVARLDAAGAVFLGKTGMNELAFSGLGINPHFGTPPNALDPELIPGGSSSGSAVAVASGLACAAVGSDTGGSVRIPAAFNRLVGLKTSEGAVPTDGCVPLSTTLDTIGPIARNVADAWVLYRALAALPPATLPVPPLRMRFAVVEELCRDLDPQVETAFEAAVTRFRELGHDVERVAAPLVTEIEETMSREGGFAANEALALYEDMIENHGDEMDRRVVARITAARGKPATGYIRLCLARRRWQQEFWGGLRGVDAVLAPTVPILPPRLADLESDEAFFAANAACLRNTSFFNAVGGCAASVPAGDDLAGIMIAASAGSEGVVLAAGSLLEGD